MRHTKTTGPVSTTGHRTWLQERRFWEAPVRTGWGRSGAQRSSPPVPGHCASAFATAELVTQPPTASPTDCCLSTRNEGTSNPHQCPMGYKHPIPLLPGGLGLSCPFYAISKQN